MYSVVYMNYMGYATITYRWRDYPIPSADEIRDMQHRFKALQLKRKALDITTDGLDIVTPYMKKNGHGDTVNVIKENLVDELHTEYYYP